MSPALPIARTGRRLAGLVAACVLAACAAPEAPGTLPDGASQWQGRFALTLTEPGVEQRQEQAQGRFLLRSRDAREHLEVASPFGQTLAVLDSRPGEARLQTSDGRTLSAVSADLLLEQALGWRLPVEALPGWLGSVPGQDPPDTGDWAVRVVSRFDDGRPRVLDARWPARGRIGLRELKVRIVVDGR